MPLPLVECMVSRCTEAHLTPVYGQPHSRQTFRQEAADAVVKEGRASAPADPNTGARRHAPNDVREMVSSHGRQRSSLLRYGRRGLMCPTDLYALTRCRLLAADLIYAREHGIPRSRRRGTRCKNRNNRPYPHLLQPQGVRGGLCSVNHVLELYTGRLDCSGRVPLAPALGNPTNFGGPISGWVSHSSGQIYFQRLHDHCDIPSSSDLDQRRCRNRCRVRRLALIHTPP